MSTTTFSGWGTPQENWCKMPFALIDAFDMVTTIAEMKVVLYVLRHTWGYREYDSSKLISMNEFMKGRRRRDGSRLDGGTGLSINSVRAGIDLAVEHKLLTVVEDKRDAGRIKHYYRLYNSPALDDDAGESLPPSGLPDDENDDDQGADLGPKIEGGGDQTLIPPDQTLIPPGSNFDPRTKKDTKKDTLQLEVKSGAGAEKISAAETDQTAQPVSVTEVFDFSTLPPDNPRRIEHERMLGILRPEDRRGNSKKDQQIVVNDEGLTQRLRTALVAKLIPIKKVEALIELGDEEDLIAVQEEAEKLYRMGVDTPEKMEALGKLWDERNSIPPHGKLLLKFQSQIMAEMEAQKNGKSSTNKNGANNYASSGRGRGNHAQTGGRLAQWEQEHGEITWEQQVPEAILSQWPKADKLDYQRKWQASYDNYHAAHAADEPASDVFDLQGWLQEQSFAGAAG